MHAELSDGWGVAAHLPLVQARDFKNSMPHTGSVRQVKRKANPYSKLSHGPRQIVVNHAEALVGDINAAVPRVTDLN